MKTTSLLNIISIYFRIFKLLISSKIKFAKVNQSFIVLIHKKFFRIISRFAALQYVRCHIVTLQSVNFQRLYCFKLHTRKCESCFSFSNFFLSSSLSFSGKSAFFDIQTSISFIFYSRIIKHIDVPITIEFALFNVTSEPIE